MPRGILAAVLVIVVAATAGLDAARKYTPQEAPYVVNALYQALLGRNTDDASMSGAALELQKGNLRRQVGSIVGSQEFSRSSRKSAEIMLQQIYNGLLGRQPDDSGRKSYYRRIEQRRYTDVVVSLVESPEFENRLRHRPRPR